MKRLLSIIMLIVCVLAKADAQYYSVNYDKQTVAAMQLHTERKPWQRHTITSRCRTY